MRELLPAPAAVTSPPEASAEDGHAACGSRKADRLERVRQWYLALPAEVRDWSTRAIVDDPDYGPVLEELTETQGESVRKTYLGPVRRDLGEGTRNKKRN